MTGGSEVRPDGTVVTLGADWTFVGEAMSSTKLASAALVMAADARRYFCRGGGWQSMLH